MKLVTHAGGRRPSFRWGQRKYSVAICGAIVYDNSQRLFACGRRQVTCKKCREKAKASRLYRQKCAREDRKKQLINYRERRQRENVMRARFGLKPVKYEPPPPSDYWSSW